MAKHIHLITQAAFEKVKPAAVRREIPDGGGLYLVIQPTGAKTWVVRYRRDGRPRKFTLGAVNLKTARDLARKASETVARGGDPGAAKIEARRAAADGRASFESVAALFLDRYINRKKKRPRPRTLAEMARQLGMVQAGENWEAKPGGLAYRWRGRKVGDITKGDIHARLDEQMARGFSAAANGLRSVLHLFFGWSVKRGLAASNPCAGIDPPGEQISRNRVLDDDELALFWQAAGAEGTFGAMLKILALTGQRRDEARGMTWAELDLDEGLWKIPAARAKNGHEHLVPLAPLAVEILKSRSRIAGGHDLVFAAPGGGLLGGLSRAKQKLDDRMLALARECDPAFELETWVIHDLRRSCATGLQGLNIALPVIEKILNHTSGSFRGVVSIYQRHDLLEDRRAALLAWARHIASLTEETSDNILPFDRAAQ